VRLNVIQVLTDRDLELKSWCEGKVNSSGFVMIGIGSCGGKVVYEILSHITPSCIALSSKKLRANIRTDGRKPDERERASGVQNLVPI
jgi:hypothetical protein